jgi:hypothetical protein
MHQKETLHACILNYNTLPKVVLIITISNGSKGRQVGMASTKIVHT